MSLRFKRMIKRMFTPVFEGLATITKQVNAFIYKCLYIFEWFVDQPENFDHEIDLYWQWNERCMPYWLERGIYSIQALKMFKNPMVIELCCGDGFNAKHFYATSAARIFACDFDEKIIRTARKKNQKENITFQVADIRHGISKIWGGALKEEVTNVIWDAAIEHFTPTEINNIMKDIKDILYARKGILSGYTIVERKDGKSLEQHEYEFKNMEDLKQFLTPYFRNVFVFETIYSDRHNLYFYASDGSIPFEKGWQHGRINTGE